MFRPVTMALGMGFLLLVASCGEDATAPQAVTGGLTGSVSATGDGEPVAGAAVIVVTDEFSIVQVTGTDAGGGYAFTDLPAGSFQVYALDEHHLLVEWHDARVHITGGQTTTADLLMVPSDHTSPLAYRIAGRVTDAATGLPVMGAWVMPVGYGEAGNSVRYLTNNSGLVTGVSDAQGRYSLPVWPVRTDYPDGPVRGLGAVSCAAGGFRPRTFVGAVASNPDMPWLEAGLLPAPPDSVLVLDIALERIPAGGLPAAETGKVRGRVVRDGIPVPAVMVTTTLTVLAHPDTVPDPVKVAVSGGALPSATDGTFELDLEPGWYSVRLGLTPDDGWRDGEGGMVEVAAGLTVELGDLEVVPAVRPVSPGRDARVAYPLTTLAWTSVPAAERYEVQVSSDQGYYFSTTTSDTFCALPDPSALPAGAAVYRWEVYASLLIEPPFYTRINSFEVPANFSVGLTSER